MKFEIKSRWSGSILFEGEFGSMKLCLKAAVQKGAYLKGAYLEGADLKGAYLEGAYLEGAYLEGAYLEGAYLEGADLEGAYLKGADLKGAYLKGAYLEGAYLEGADLKGADLKGAYLEGADLEGAYLEGALNGKEKIKIPTITKPYTKILNAIKNKGCVLEMGKWHTCGTTHCIGGWVSHLAGKAGKTLEDKIGMPGTATLILKKSGSKIPNYWASNEDAMQFVEKMAKAEAR